MDITPPPLAAACMKANDGGMHTLRQLAVLVTVDRFPGKSVRHYAEALGVARPAITRACDLLVEAALLQRREVALTVTHDGRTLLSLLRAR